MIKKIPLGGRVGENIKGGEGVGGPLDCAWFDGCPQLLTSSLPSFSLSLQNTTSRDIFSVKIEAIFSKKKKNLTWWPISE